MATPVASDELIDQLRQQLAEVENRFVQSQQEKTQMEAEFEYKRSKIKELYYAKENTIVEQNAKLFEASKQISELEASITSLHDEMDNLKMIASVSESTKQEAVEDLDKHHQQEIESLRCVLKDTMEEQRGDLLVQFEQERRHWEQEKVKMEEEQKKLRELWSQAQSSLKLKTDEFSVLVDRELETSMMKAQHEAENLKSVVVPLENEISELRGKLKQAEDEILKFTSDKQVDVNGRISLLGSEGVAEADDDRLPAKQEKSLRPDLELYTEVLDTEIGVLQQENDLLKREMHEVCRLLEHEQAEHSELKQTWNAANEHFLLSQNDLNAKLKTMRSLLTEEQLKGLVSSNNGTKEIYHEGDHAVKDTREDDHASSDVHQSAASVNGDISPRISTRNGSSFGSFQSYQIPNQSNVPSSETLESLTSPATELQDGLSVSSMPGRNDPSELETPKPMRANSAPNLKQLAEQSDISSLNRSATTKESSKLQATTSPQHDAEQTSTRQLTLLRIKESEIEKLNKECDDLREAVKQAEKKCKEEKQLRSDVEESVMQSSEDAQKQIRNLVTKLTDLEKLMSQDQSYRRKKEAEDNEKLMEVTNDRSKVLENYRVLKNEQIALKSSFEKCRIGLEKDSHLPTTMEGLKVCLDKYREGYAALQVERLQLESSLQTQISFLRSASEAQQREKDQIESTLSIELEEARETVVQLKAQRESLRKQAAEKQELQVQVERDQLSMESIRAKSRDIIKSLKDKLLNETSEKEALENQLARAKNQVRSLQEALETSEHVQRDFVKLSQSLQVKLEEIRQKEEEAKEKRAATQVVESPPDAATSSRDVRASSDQPRLRSRRT